MYSFCLTATHLLSIVWGLQVIVSSEASEKERELQEILLPYKDCFMPQFHCLFLPLYTNGQLSLVDLDKGAHHYLAIFMGS